MRIIPTRVHGMLDYGLGLLLIAAPWLFDFANGGPEQWIPVILGASVILYSMVTDYELSIVDALPMSAHLALDAMGGALLAVSPWLFGFADTVWVPHVVFGLLEIGAAVMTHSVPDHERVGAGGRGDLH